MSIRIITGRPQQHQALSSIIYKEIGNVLNAQRQKRILNDRKNFLIVPEQYTLGAERDLMKALHQPGLIEADVLSLRRLSSRIMDEYGGNTRQVVDKQGRILLLAKAVEKVKDTFQLYRRSSHHSGFISNLSDVMTEFKQNQIGIEDLENILPQIGADSWTGQKLSEMTVVYRQYETELGESRWDIDQFNRHLCAGIRQSEMLHHARIWLDGFFTFSVNDFAVIEAIATRADEITFTLTGDLDRNIKDAQIFTVCRNTSERLAEIAARTGHDFRIENNVEKNPEESPYSVLRDEVFAYIQDSWQEQTDFVEIYHYRDPWQEAVSTARRISNAVRERGFRYQDIAILCGSIEEHGPILLRALEDAQIPAFCDLPVQIGEDPLIEGFLSAFEAATTHFQASALAAYAQSGYSPLALQDYYPLENYALAKGIRGLKWQRPIEEDETNHRWNTVKLEKSRKVFIDPLIQWREQLKEGKTYRHYLTTAVHFLEKTDVYQRLMDFSDRLAAEGDYENAGRTRQVWNYLMNLFDQIDQTMGEASCDSAAFIQVIKSGIETCRIGVLPNRRDVVQIIDPLRSRGSKIKALFIVGANEGVLPAEAPDYPLLSEEDRALLFGLGLQLQNDPGFRKSRMDYSLYLQMMRAEEMISISACMSDQVGTPIQPSSLFTSFRHLFPAVPVHFSEEELDWVTGGAGTLDEAIRRLKRLGQSEKEDYRTSVVLDWYRQQPQWKYQTIQGETAGNYHGIAAHDIDSNMVKDLYGREMTMSVSRIEKFNACPFAHFIHYGLKPRERETYDVNVMDMGTLLHSLIEGCFNYLTEEGLSLSELSERQCTDLVNRMMTELLSRPENRVFSDTAASRFLSKKLQRVGLHTFKMIIRHLQKGSFNYKYSEKSFLKPVVFPEFTQEIKLKGVIDRIDIYVKDDKNYTKIIDYKTGPKDIDFSKIYYGINIQLLLYLQEGLTWMAERIPDTVFLPAGAFYFHVDDPLISEIDPKVLEEKINAAFQMKGIYLNDDKVIQAMDNGVEKKSSIFDKKDACGFNADELQALMAFVSGQAEESIRAVLKGKIAVDPVRVGDFDPCSYCDCREICQLDALLNRQVYYQFGEKVSRDDLMSKIQDVIGDSDDNGEEGEAE